MRARLVTRLEADGGTGMVLPRCTYRLLALPLPLSLPLPLPFEGGGSLAIRVEGARDNTNPVRQLPSLPDPEP